MSHHMDTPEPQTNITDMYMFQKPGDPTKTIFILNVNPDAPRQATTFNPQASYELKIDTNGDAQADIAFHMLFAPAGDRQQTATVYYATGVFAESAGVVGEVIIHQASVSFGAEAQITTAGAYTFFAGLRSDPFFVDPEGFFNNFHWTGHDVNADKNVFGIVLEVPNRGLGEHPQIGVWARTVAPVHGALHQVDQFGNPGTSAVFFRAEEDKHTFISSHPTDQLARFLPKVVAIFQEYGFSEAEATPLAREWLPDIMPYDYTSAAGFPNGRGLTDDTIDWFARLVSRGQSAPSIIGPHADVLDRFPYLGPPHPIPIGQKRPDIHEGAIADA
jgi:uncharacterized protein DUF4331